MNNTEGKNPLKDYTNSEKGVYLSNRRAVQKYGEKLKELKDDIRLRVPKGWKDRMKEYVSRPDTPYDSINQMLEELIRKELNIED